MTRIDAIGQLQCRDNLDEATSIALDSLIAWNCIIKELQSKIEFSRECGAKDYSLGIDTALYIIQKHLKDEDIVC